MKAIILVAGYATRLYPLTLNTPKALLPINGVAILTYIVEEINEIDEINEIIVVSNNKFYNEFVQWEKELNNKINIKVLNDGTNTIETRLGGIGDISFAIEHEKIDEDIIVIAGDNFFTYRLKEYYDFFKKNNNDAVCAKKIENIEQLKEFAVAIVDDNNILIHLEEKPENPKSDLAVYATYFYKRETLELFKHYLEQGNNKDAPGYFVAWLYILKKISVYEMNGDCYDIGTKERYEEIQELMKKK